MGEDRVQQVVDTVKIMEEQERNQKKLNRSRGWSRQEAEDMSEMINNKETLEQNIAGEKGIGYTLGADGLYYPDLELPE